MHSFHTFDLVIIIYIFSFGVLGDRMACNTRCPQTYSVSDHGLELLILLLSKCWDYHTYLNFLLNLLFYDLSVLLQGIYRTEIFIYVSKTVGQRTLIMTLFVEIITKQSKSTSEGLIHQLSVLLWRKKRICKYANIARVAVLHTTLKVQASCTKGSFLTYLWSSMDLGASPGCDWACTLQSCGWLCISNTASIITKACEHQLLYALARSMCSTVAY